VPLTTDPERVVGFRLRRHHLDRRLGPRSLRAAVAVCGIRNSPPGSAATALAARVDRLPPSAVADAVADGSLLEVIGPRLVPTLVVPEDVAVFTIGSVPDERALRDLVGDATAKALAAAGIGLLDAVGQVTAAARAALAGGPLTRGGLSAAVTRTVPAPMSAWCGRCGSRHVSENLFRLAGGSGAYAIAPRSGRGVSLRLLDPPGTDPRGARLELLRRFLRCHGPATPEDYARWTMTVPAYARRRWAELAGDLAEVTWPGRSGSILAADAARLRAATPPTGVRLLPPGDPYLQSPDRAALVPDASHRRTVWPALAAPGVVLLDGCLAGTWRAQRRGGTLLVQVTGFSPLPAAARPALDAEAARLAPVRGCETAGITLEQP
jgi:hypothetical protein